MKCNKKDVAVIFGGMASEHEVSCMSAAGIYKNIDRTKYNVHMIGITKKGQWLLTPANSSSINDGTWINDQNNKNVSMSVNRAHPGIIVFYENLKENIHIDCAFPILHGKFGEDGSIQGLLEYAGIPYVGCGLKTSAVGFDKALTKKVVNSINVRQAKCFVLRKDEFADKGVCIDKIQRHFSGQLPLFVKPASEGSSYGVTRVDDYENLCDAISEGFKYDDKLLVEECIIGREIEVAILGSGDTAKASSIGEIVANAAFYSYDAKYNSSASVTRVVNDISADKIEEIQETSLKIYKKLNCNGLSRIDFFLKDTGEFIFNEINTVPGFTSISMYPQLWQNDGIEYADLISLLIEDVLI